MRLKAHLAPLALFGALAVLWTWPLALHFRDHIPGLPGDNFSFLWNLWWARKAWDTSGLGFFHSTYLLSPFGVDLVNHPHTALQGLISAVGLRSLTVIEAENLYILVSVFLNTASAYFLGVDVVGRRLPAVLTAVAFGGSPYIAAHLMGHFDLLSAWVLPMFALFFRRALRSGRIADAAACGVVVALAAYTAYYHVVYLALFAVAYVTASQEWLSPAWSRRPETTGWFTVRLLIVGLAALDLFVIAFILLTGGTAIQIGSIEISMQRLQNPFLGLWCLGAAWLLARYKPAVRRSAAPAVEFWRGMQTLTVAAATFVICAMPLVLQAFKLLVSGRYVTQEYFWRSAPRGVDLVAPLLGNPFHPLWGGAVSRAYAALGLDRIEAVGWIGIVPVVLLFINRGSWFDREEARRWATVAVVFAIWALGPFLVFAGADLGLPLPQALARFVPFVENARMPGRAMVEVYLALGVLLALRVAAAEGKWREPFALAVATAVLLLDFLHAPIPLTALDRPEVYAVLAAIPDSGAVIEVPFGIGDGLSTGVGDQDRRVLYYATIHGHPLVGGFIGRMPPGLADAYEAMPVVGNLLRLSNGEAALPEEPAVRLPFRYLVLNTKKASSALGEYIRSTLDLDAVASADGLELYAVQGVKPPDLRASR